MSKSSPIAMTDDGLLTELILLSEKIGATKFTGFVPKKLIEYQQQYRYEILRRLSAQIINTEK